MPARFSTVLYVHFFCSLGWSSTGDEGAKALSNCIKTINFLQKLQ